VVVEVVAVAMVEVVMVLLRAVAVAVVAAAAAPPHPCAHNNKSLAACDPLIRSLSLSSSDIILHPPFRTEQSVFYRFGVHSVARVNAFNAGANTGRARQGASLFSCRFISSQSPLSRSFFVDRGVPGGV
jgi:hypothetical protein